MIPEKSVFTLYLLLLVGMIGFFFLPFSTALISDGLVGHWTFDESLGTSATDVSGNGNIGLLMNGPTVTAGKFGNALQLDGLDDYVDLGNSTWNINQEFTLSR